MMRKGLELELLKGYGRKYIYCAIRRYTMNPECPYLRVSRTYDYSMDEVFEGWYCTLNNKICLLELDIVCETYNKFKEEYNDPKFS